MSVVSLTAPAKVNLYLHVTGRRNDGYHLLDSLFVFTKDGDVVHVRKSDRLALKLTGPYADSLRYENDNIVLKAVRLLASICGQDCNVEITLEKNLPVSSGIGGGSADAAATLKALLILWNQQMPIKRLQEIALSLGADVPSCLQSRPVQVSGIGDILKPAPNLPSFSLVLVNPNRPVSTPEVFKKRLPVFSDPAPFTEDMKNFDDFIQALQQRHNDLTQAACQLEPEVLRVLEVLQADPLCRLARMSGSGGTCFGVFPNVQEASLCCEWLSRKYPDWWFFNTFVH